MADIQIVGNIGRIDDLKNTNNGKAVLSLSVADDHNRRQNGEWVKEGTNGWRVTAWERQAETLAEHVQKGDRVLVTGTVKSREWEDNEGQKRVSYDVTARHVAVIPKAGQSSQAPSGGAAGDPWATGQSFDSTPPF